MTQATPSRPFASLRARLALLVSAVLIPAMLTAGLLLWNAYQQEQRSMARQMSETTRALSLVVDRQIGQQRVLLEALAASPHIASGDWRAFDAQARHSSTNFGGWVALGDADTGRQLVNTAVAYGSPLPLRSVDTHGVTWTQIPGEASRISNLFVGRVAHRPVIAMDIPVRRPDGSVVRLGVVTPAASFARVLEDQGFPEGWVGSIVDARGVIVARNRESERFVGTSASAGMIARLRSRPLGVAETTTLDGMPSRTAWSRAPDYGWSFIVAAPRSQVEGAAKRSLYFGGLIGLLFLAIGLALASIVARSIARPVEDLAAAAKAWADGAAVDAPRSGLAETDGLAGVLDAAAATVNRQRAELLDLNASLEARVAERTRELSAANDSLAQAQKMEAIGRLTGGVAHDFNNLLMAMLGNLDLLSRRLTEPKLLRYVDNARAAGDRGAKLTAQLLAFSRRQRIEAQPMDMGGAVGAAAALLGPTLGVSHRLAVDLGPDLWTAIGDPTQVELMVVNLALNARDAMPAGGEVRLSATNVRRDAPADSPEGPPAGEFVMIAVADQGEGMAPDVVARVFEPFFTTKAIGKGSGLGLPQVLGLAKQLAGGVEIDSAAGEGTIVRVFLPRTTVDAVAETRQVSAPDRTNLRGLRLLLVDDDPDVRSVTALMLTELGCLVTEADGGLTAQRRLRDDPALQGALIDFAMPGLNGGETAAALRIILPGLPVTLMTGYADMEELARAWSGPVMRKPFTLETLAHEIARLALKGSTASAT